MALIGGIGFIFIGDDDYRIAIVANASMLFIPGLIFFIWNWRNLRKDICAFNREKSKLFVDSKNLEEAEKEIELIEAKLRELNSELERTKARYERAKEAKKKELMPSVLKMKEFIAGMEEQFGGVLDGRDWENLDLVIFAIETRRADSVKEALLYVDGEVRTDRIVQSVQHASKEIGSGISRGLRNLSADINQNFDRLSSRIEGVGAMIGAQNEHIKSLVGAQELNNALVAQCAKSSVHLSEDVKAIRDNSDYFNRRLRSS